MWTTVQTKYVLVPFAHPSLVFDLVTRRDLAHDEGSIKYGMVNSLVCDCTGVIFDASITQTRKQRLTMCVHLKREVVRPLSVRPGGGRTIVSQTRWW